MKPRRGEVPKMYQHLRKCVAVPSDVHKWAEARIEERNGKKKGGKRTHSDISDSSDSEVDKENDSRRHPRHAEPLSAHSSTSSVLSNATNTPSKRSRLAAPVDPTARQEQFNTDLCRLFVANDIAWNVANNPETVRFFRKWVPDVEVPDRRVLSGRVLNAEAFRVEQEMKQELDGKLAMGQCDGWKNVAKHAVQATSVNVEHQPYLISTHVVSEQRKTADNLLRHILADIAMIVAFGMTLIGWCTDNGPDARGMRRQLREMMPSLILLECWAHQMHLVVGDYIRLKLRHVQVIDEALDIINWFNNHSMALTILHEDMRSNRSINNSVLALVLPVLTRWACHYLSIARLLRVSSSIRSCVDKSRADLEAAGGTKPEQVEKSRQILDTIERPSFWKDLVQVQLELRPLAIASNICQASATRLDQVLLTLANLYRLYLDPAITPAARDGIHASLEKRWKQTEQHAFILATVLNPFIRDTCFNPDNIAVTPNALYKMAEDLFTRMFEKTPDPEFYDAFMDYLDNQAEFSDDAMATTHFKEQAERANDVVDLCRIWRNARRRSRGNGAGRSQLVDFAIRLLSIVPNTGDSERLFSVKGLVHTKLRNRLDEKVVHKTVVVRNNIKQGHREQGLLPKRLKRILGVRDDLEQVARECEDSPTSQGTGAIEEGTASASTAFSSLAGRLADDADKDDDGANAGELHHTQPHPGANSTSGQRGRAYQVALRDGLKLANLFKYPDPSQDDAGLAFYWHGGIKALDEEMALYDLVFEPTMRDTPM